MEEDEGGGKDRIFSQGGFLTPSELNSNGPEKLLGLFEVDEMLEIGDEVTVPSSPLLSFPTDSDHCYFSVATPSSMRFDCISEPSLPEFQDLFDLTSDYGPFDFNRGENLDLHEQVIEDSNQFGIKGFGNPANVWNHSSADASRESSTESNENEMDTSSSSDSDEREQEVSDSNASRRGKLKRRKQKSNQTRLNKHHTGPFPHTFIPTPGDRRIRFCFGLQTIVTKIKALMARTGAIADFRAEFEGHTFTLENVEKQIKFSNRSQKLKNKKLAELETESDIKPLSESPSPGAADDHQYAATILRQSESSPVVRDHQYNDTDTAVEDSKMKGKTAAQKAFIRTRYARERWLRKGATTIYSKMQRLMNRTGAKMTLTIEYQGLLVTPKNYKELEHLLGQYRPTMKKFNTKIVIEKRSSVINHPLNIETQSPSNSSSGDTVMKVSFPNRGSNQSVNVEFLTGSTTSNNTKTRDLQTVIESDHDYESSLHGQPSPRNSDTTLDYSTIPGSPSSTVSVPELSLLPESHLVESFAPFALQAPLNLDYDAVKRTSDAFTNTDPGCEICGKSDQQGLAGEDKFPAWIRCANPLCHYLVHPACIGFFVMNAQHLQFLPPFLCPSHRQQN